MDFKIPKTFGIVGSGGNFGSFVEKHVRSEAPFIKEVRGYDKYKPCTHTLKQVAESDIVMLAPALDHLEESLPEVLAEVSPTSVLVEVGTNKAEPKRLIEQLAPDQLVIWLHPLFGEQSFIDNGCSFKGLQLAVCGQQNVGHRVFAAACRFLRNVVGLDLVEMDPDEHDRDVVANEQFITQYTGLVTREAGFSLNEKNAHTLSARHYFRAMGIVSGDENLFWAVYDKNPHCVAAAERFEQAVMRLRAKRLARGTKLGPVPLPYAEASA